MIKKDDNIRKEKRIIDFSLKVYICKVNLVGTEICKKELLQGRKQKNRIKK